MPSAGGRGWISAWPEVLRLIQRGEPGKLPGLTWNGAAASSRAVNHDVPSVTCDECGSSFFAETSRMAALCPECAHHLYGYPACEHSFVAGRCEKCGWDGSVSPYVASLTGKGKTLR